MAKDPLRFLNQIEASTFGDDRFGTLAENIARLFGTAKYIMGQTVLVIIWITLNLLCVALRWDPYPFILLNLAFSTQAAYAAPLILLAQTRQADRDKVHAEATAQHNQEESDHIKALLEANTRLTEEIHSHIKP